jgi:hypothetical protein
MVLWIVMPFSIFLLHWRKIETMSKSSGAVHLSLDCDGSEVVNCNSIVVDCYIVSVGMTDRCCFWKRVLCWFGLLGRFAWSKFICCFNAEYRWAFLRLRFLAGDAS